MYQDFKNIHMNKNPSYYIGSKEFDAINERLKQHVIDDNMKGINQLFNKYGADHVLFNPQFDEANETKKFLSLFNLATEEIQQHLIYHLANTQKFNQNTKAIFNIISNIVYMKDNTSNFVYFLDIMEEKQHLFQTYSEEEKFILPSTILNKVFQYGSNNILKFLCQSSEFNNSLNANKDWKFIKQLTNGFIQTIPEDRAKQFIERIDYTNLMLNALFDSNPSIKEKIEPVVIQAIKRFIHDNDTYHLSKMYHSFLHKFFDNLYIHGVIDYESDIKTEQEESISFDPFKMEDSDFSEIKQIKSIFNITESKMIELEKLKIEKMMPSIKKESDKKIKI